MTKLWRISPVNPNYREWEKMMPNIQLQDARNQHLRVFSMSRTENIKTFWMYSNLKNIIEYENHNQLSGTHTYIMGVPVEMLTASLQMA